MKTEEYVVEQIIAIEAQFYPNDDEIGMEEQIELRVLYDILDRDFTEEEEERLRLERIEVLGEEF